MLVHQRVAVKIIELNGGFPSHVWKFYSPSVSVDARLENQTWQTIAKPPSQKNIDESRARVQSLPKCVPSISNKHGNGSILSIADLQDGHPELATPLFQLSAPTPCLSSQPLDASITGSVQVRPCPAVKPAQWLKVGCTYSSRAPGAYWTPPRSHGLVGNLLIVGTMQWGGFTVYQGDGILFDCHVGFWGKLKKVDEYFYQAKLLQMSCWMCSIKFYLLLSNLSSFEDPSLVHKRWLPVLKPGSIGNLRGTRPLLQTLRWHWGLKKTWLGSVGSL